MPDFSVKDRVRFLKFGIFFLILFVLESLAPFLQESLVFSLLFIYFFKLKRSVRWSISVCICISLIFWRKSTDRDFCAKCWVLEHLLPLFLRTIVAILGMIGSESFRSLPLPALLLRLIFNGFHNKDRIIKDLTCFSDCSFFHVQVSKFGNFPKNFWPRSKSLALAKKFGLNCSAKRQTDVSTSALVDDVAECLNGLYYHDVHIIT